MKIGLDIDGVLANFPEAVIAVAKKMGLGDGFPDHWRDVNCWFMSRNGRPDAFNEVWPHIKDDPYFWLSIPALPYSVPLDFDVDCYITSRPIGSVVSAKWLERNGFPKAEVITVERPEHKLEHILARGLDLFVDDHWENVRYLRSRGVNAVLFDAPYQRGHETNDLPKIWHLREVRNGYWISNGNSEPAAEGGDHQDAGAQGRCGETEDGPLLVDSAGGDIEGAHLRGAEVRRSQLA